MIKCSVSEIKKLERGQSFPRASDSGVQKGHTPFCSSPMGFLWPLPTIEDVWYLELLPNITLEGWPSFTNTCPGAPLSISFPVVVPSTVPLQPFDSCYLFSIIPSLLEVAAIPLSSPHFFFQCLSPSKLFLPQGLCVWGSFCVSSVPQISMWLPPYLHSGLNSSVSPPGSFPWLHWLNISSP